MRIEGITIPMLMRGNLQKTNISKLTEGEILMNKILLAAAATILSLIASTIYAGVDDVDTIPWIREGGREAYKDKYLPAAKSRAFAISTAGNYSYSVKRDSPFRAAQFALYNCLKVSTKKCVLYAVDEKVVFDSYKLAETDSISSLEKLKAPTKAVYADEDKVTELVFSEGLKSGKLHEPTPTSVPFATTITTSRLVEMLLTGVKPIIIDVLQPQNNYRKDVIPTAIWVFGAGMFDEKVNDKIDDYFAKFMVDAVPEKNTPIVAYCLSWECWLSVNALQRLNKQGYRNLYWYRGGIESWQRAGLPTVEAPLSAQVW